MNPQHNDNARDLVDKFYQILKGLTISKDDILELSISCAVKHCDELIDNGGLLGRFTQDSNVIQNNIKYYKSIREHVINLR